jgi:hypothetical protein
VYQLRMSSRYVDPRLGFAFFWMGRMTVYCNAYGKWRSVGFAPFHASRLPDMIPSTLGARNAIAAARSRGDAHVE